jgi:hypothetical protein
MPTPIYGVTTKKQGHPLAVTWRGRLKPHTLTVILLISINVQLGAIIYLLLTR